MWLHAHAKNKEWCKVAWFAYSYVPLIRCLSKNQNKTKRNPWTNKNLEIWKCPVVQRSVALRQKIKEDGLIPEVTRLKRLPGFKSCAKVAQRNPSETENIYLPKYGFCNKSFWKDEPLISWTLLQHICPHQSKEFWILPLS